MIANNVSAEFIATTAPDTRRTPTLVHRAPATRGRARGGTGNSAPIRVTLWGSRPKRSAETCQTCGGGPCRGGGSQQPKRKRWGSTNTVTMGTYGSDDSEQRPIKLEQQRRSRRTTRSTMDSLATAWTSTETADLRRAKQKKKREAITLTAKQIFSEWEHQEKGSWESVKSAQ